MGLIYLKIFFEITLLIDKIIFFHRVSSYDLHCTARVLENHFPQCPKRLNPPYMLTTTNNETSTPKSGGSFFQTCFFGFGTRTIVSRPPGVLPRGLGIIIMMKIENPKYFFEKSLFSTSPEQNPVGPKVQLLKKNTNIFGVFLRQRR